MMSRRSRSMAANEGLLKLDQQLCFAVCGGPRPYGRLQVVARSARVDLPAVSRPACALGARRVERQGDRGAPSTGLRYADTASEADGGGRLCAPSAQPLG